MEYKVKLTTKNKYREYTFEAENLHDAVQQIKKLSTEDLIRTAEADKAELKGILS